jgi:hypothetical protein
MDHVTEILSTVAEHLGEECPRHADIFRAAVRRTPPVYFRQKYADFFWQCIETIPNWLPRVVLSSASTENSGSHALLNIWARVNYHAAAENGILQHAKDESRHARMFLEVARLTFRDSYDSDVLQNYESCLTPLPELPATKQCECVIPEETLLDYVIQLNIVEMRTRLHLHLIAPAYYGLTKDLTKRTRVEGILHSLARDEARHIAYTSKLLDQWAMDGVCTRAKLVELYSQRLADYNAHTLDHCDRSVHDYGQGVMPDFVCG